MWLGTLDRERGAGAPAEPARRARSEIAARPGRRAVLGQQRVFVDEDRIGVARRGEAGADPGRVDRPQRFGLIDGLPPGVMLRLAAFADPLMARGDRRLV